MRRTSASPRVFVLPMIEGVEGKDQISHVILNRQGFGGALSELDPGLARMGSRPLRCNIEHPQDRVDSNKRPVRDSGRSVPQGRTSPAPNIHDDRAGSQVQRLHGKTVRGVLPIFAGIPLGRLSVPHTHRLDCENPGPAAALRAGLGRQRQRKSGCGRLFTPTADRRR